MSIEETQLNIIYVQLMKIVVLLSGQISENLQRFELILYWLEKSLPVTVDNVTIRMVSPQNICVWWYFMFQGKVQIYDYCQSAVSIL